MMPAPSGAAQLDDCQPLPAFTTTSGEDFAAAFGGFTSPEANLAGALFAVWAKCRLHD
jgi:hypothetical protein